MNSDMKEMFERIEYLREQAHVSYEEAATLLERYDGDMTRVMIELERDGRLNNHKDWIGQAKAYGKAHAEECKRAQHNPDHWFHKLIHAKIRVNRNGERLVDVPVVAAGIVTIIAPYLTIAGAVGGFLIGCRIEYPRNNSAS